MGLKKLLNLKLCSYVRAEVCGLVELWLNFIRKHGEHTHVVGNQKVFEASWLYKKPELEAGWIQWINGSLILHRGEIGVGGFHKNTSHSQSYK